MEDRGFAGRSCTQGHDGPSIAAVSGEAAPNPLFPVLSITFRAEILANLKPEERWKPPPGPGPGRDAMPIEGSKAANGRAAVGPLNETIVEIASGTGVPGFRLCYEEGMRPDGNCRAASVRSGSKGEGVVAALRLLPLLPGGHGVSADSAAMGAGGEGQKMVDSSFSSLRSCPERSYTSTILEKHRSVGEGAPDRQAALRRWRVRPEADLSRLRPSRGHLDACIDAGRCVRACREEQGAATSSAMPLSLASTPRSCSTLDAVPWATPPCVACGECVAGVPDGRPHRRRGTWAEIQPEPDRRFRLPTAGVGCPAHLTSEASRQIHSWVEGRGGPANR